MAIETQQQLARESVQSVATEVGRSHREARMQRAAEQTTQRMQIQANPDTALRALAYGEGEGLRDPKNKDWRKAVREAEDWRKKTKAKPRPGFFEGRRERKQKVSELIGSGMSVLDAEQKVKEDFDKRPTKREVQATQKEIAEVESTHIEAINAEEGRLIEKKVRGLKRALTDDELQKEKDDARQNVLAAVKFEEMQMQEVRQQASKNPIVNELLADQIAREQSVLKRPLTTEETSLMRERIVDDLAEKAMTRIRESEARKQVVDQRLVSHPQFTEKFLTALGGVDVESATPDQLAQARAKALEETKTIVEKEEQDKMLEREKEKKALRQEPVWKKAYALLINQELSSGAVITPDLREELLESADRLVKAEQADRNVTAQKEELLERQNVRDDVSSRFRVSELVFQVKVTEDVAAKAGPRDKKAHDDASKAKESLAGEIRGYVSAADRARKAADANPKDSSLQQRATLLEERARKAQGLASSLESQSIDDVKLVLEDEQKNLQSAQDEVIQQKRNVTESEVRLRLLQHTDIDILDIPSILDDVPPQAIEQINRALSADTHEGRVQEINVLKDKAKKGKAGVSKTALLAILASIGIGLTKAGEQILE